MAGRPGKYWMLLVILILVAIIGAGAVSARLKYGRSQPVEISIPPTPELPGFDIYIGGAVNSPGFYPLKAGDTISSIIQSAGGMTGNADLSGVRIYISENKQSQSQFINLNRAEAWLLEALPGIGEAKAQAIIDYRNQNGGFRNINELLEVKGISPSIYEQIKSFITVADQDK